MKDTKEHKGYLLFNNVRFTFKVYLEENEAKSLIFIVREYYIRSV